VVRQDPAIWASAMADRVGSSKPRRVVESPVDRLGVVATLVQILEVRIAGWDGSDVLGAVEPALRVFVVAVEADGYDGAAQVVGEPVMVVQRKLPIMSAARLVRARRCPVNIMSPPSLRKRR
jgi:hypothetical protein